MPDKVTGQNEITNGVQTESNRGRERSGLSFGAVASKAQ